MERPAGWLTAPGIVPLFLSVGLGIMAALIGITAIRRGTLTREAVRRLRPSDSAGGLRFAVLVGAIAAFYFGLLAFLPFEVACFLFLLFVFHMLWTDAPLWKQAATAAAMSLILVASFQTVFDIPLPGENNLLEMLQFRLRR